jgi:dienelactone hydrolase
VARLNRRALSLLLALLVAPILAAGARAEEKWGVVFLHGKRGAPDKGVTALTGALAEAGYVVETPELCWSAKRIYDRAYLDCLAEIDAAIAADKAKGAAKIVLGGLDLGANAAIGYAARHDGIAAILAVSPSHSPERLATVPEIEASLTVARALIIAGHGDAPTGLSDYDIGARQPAFSITTTPRIYLGFFGSDSPALMPVNIKKILAPILWLAASDDQNQHGIDYAYNSAPKNPLNRYITLDSDQIQLPYLAVDDVLGWLKEVRKATDGKP